MSGLNSSILACSCFRSLISPISDCIFSTTFASSNNIPKCLLEINGESVISNIEKICNDNDIKDINIVGGFEILKIMQQYPTFQFFYNEKWKETNSLYSLFKVISILNDDIIISYSDIIHKPQTIKKLIKNTNSINIVYDSLWEDRYENRDLYDFEKIYLFYINVNANVALYIQFTSAVGYSNFLEKCHRLFHAN